MNNPLLLIAFGVIILLSLFSLLTRFHGQKDTKQAANTAGTYEAAPFLSKAERSFFGVIYQSMGSEFHIFSKVRLADLVHPTRNGSRSGWQASFNRIACKHVDFVFCDPRDLRVVGVIELDDKTHDRFDRGLRDGLVDSALSDAKIPILRVPAQQGYAPTQIREQIMSSFTRVNNADSIKKSTIESRPDLTE